MKTKILMALLLIILTMGAISAADNNTTSDTLTVNEDLQTESSLNLEDESVNEDMQLESDNGEILEHELDSNLESKKTTDISFRNTEPIYGAINYNIMVKTPKVDINNIKLYLDEKKANYEMYDNWDSLEFYIEPNNLTIGNHSLKVEFTGDENYLANTVTQTISMNAKIGYPYWLGEPYCFLILPEDAEGSLVVYINGEKYSQSKIINGSAEIAFDDVKPGTYNLSAEYDGKDYPVIGLTDKLQVYPKIKSDLIEDCENITILFYEDATGNITIEDANTNEILIELPVIGGKANATLGHLGFSKQLLIRYHGDDYNFTESITHNWDPITIDEYFCIGPGSYISFTLGKNTTGTASIELHEDFEGYGYETLWENYQTLAETEYSNGTAMLYLPGLSGGSYTFRINISDEVIGEYSNEIFAKITPTVRIPEVMDNIGEIEFDLYKAEGPLDIYIDGEVYSSGYVENGTATAEISGLSYGKHNITLYFKGKEAMDRIFYENLTQGHYNIDIPYQDWYTPQYSPRYENYYDSYIYTQEIFYEGPVSIKADDVILGNPAIINIKARDNAKNVVVTVLDKDYALNSSELNITLPDLGEGTYAVGVSYVDNNIPYNFNKTFSVSKTTIGTFSELEYYIKTADWWDVIELDKDYVNNGTDTQILISIPITIDGKGHVLDANNLSGIFNITGSPDFYSYPIVILKNIIFKNGNAEKGGAIYAYDKDWSLINCTFIQCSAKEGGAIYSDGYHGDVYSPRGEKWCRNIINTTFIQCSAQNDGGAIYSIGDADMGWGSYHITDSLFTQCSAGNNGGAISGDGYCEIVNSTFTKCSADNNGGAVNSKDYWCNIINSTFTKCSAKKYGGAIYFEKEECEIFNSHFKDNTATKGHDWYPSDNAEVFPKIIASNAKVTYNTGSYYSINVYGGIGKLANNVRVVVKVNGKSFKTLKTTKGIAKFKVTQTPGTYKLTITALGKTVTKTLTVKHVVTLKTATVKKSAKTLTLQATLKNENTPLKNKQVTFKFNGKTYKTKTNSRGIAKATVPKSVLKKLKVGKTVTYQATYLKDTVKKTAKIKK